MKEFLSENWLALIGALAWLPILIEIILNFLRKIRYVYLDKHFIYNASAVFKNNGNTSTKTGMVFMLALNLFVYKQAYFPKNITCNITLNDGTKHSSSLYEGGLGYSDTQTPPQNHVFNFPSSFNINLNRALFSDTNNIRILPFFFENLNLQNDTNIKKIEIIFSGKLFKKKMKITNDDCQKLDFISQYDKII